MKQDPFAFDHRSNDMWLIDTSITPTHTLHTPHTPFESVFSSGTDTYIYVYVCIFIFISKYSLILCDHSYAKKRAFVLICICISICIFIEEKEDVLDLNLYSPLERRHIETVDDA